MPRRKTPAIDRLLSKYRVTESGCWEWTACRHPDGYAWFDGKGAHRVAYTLLVGPIPEGLHIDHLCRNRACINPAHLEPVTSQVNNERAMKVWRANPRPVCGQGHELTPDNRRYYIGLSRKRTPLQRWACRACDRIRHQRRYNRLKEARHV